MDEFSRIEEMYDLERHETEKMVVFSGIANDYYTVIEFEEYAGRNYFMLKIGVELPDSLMNSEEFRTFTNEIHRQVDPQIVEYRRKVFAVGAHSEDSFSDIGNRVADLLQFITANFKAFNVQTGDFFNAHDDGTLELYNIADSYFLLSKRSYEERKKENESSDKNTGIGNAVIGALVGAVLGTIICIYFYNFTFVFGDRNFGWLLGSLIAIFALVFHRKKFGVVSKKSIFSIWGIVLVFLFLSVLVVMLFDLTTMGFSVFSIINQFLLSPSNFDLIYSGSFSNLFSYWFVGSIFSAVLAFLYYWVYRKISQASREIEKV